MSDPKNLWQNQPLEKAAKPAMTLESLQLKAKQLHQKTRRELYANAAIALFVLALCSAGLVQTHTPVARLGFAIAALWTLAAQYPLHKGLWSAPDPAEAALLSALDFYRRELRRRSSLFTRALRWSIGPLVLAILTLILALTNVAKSPVQVLPFSILFIVWLALLFLQRSKDRRELADLEALAKNEALCPPSGP